MQLSITQSQAIIIKNSLNMMQSSIKEYHLYNTQLLSSSKELREIDNLFDKLSVLSDTSRADDFYKQSHSNRNGKDLDLL